MSFIKSIVLLVPLLVVLSVAAYATAKGNESVLGNDLEQELSDTRMLVTAMSKKITELEARLSVLEEQSKPRFVPTN